MIIDLFENKIVDTIEVGIAPFGLALNLERNELYSANVRSNNVSVIELDTKKITNIRVGSFPYAIEIDNTANRLFVTNQRSNSVSVINLIEMQNGFKIKIVKKFCREITFYKILVFH